MTVLVTGGTILKSTSLPLLIMSIINLFVIPFMMALAVFFRFLFAPQIPSPVGDLVFRFGTTLLPGLIFILALIASILGIIFWRIAKYSYFCFLSGMLLSTCLVIHLIIFVFAQIADYAWIVFFLIAPFIALYNIFAYTLYKGASASTPECAPIQKVSTDNGLKKETDSFPVKKVIRFSLIAMLSFVFISLIGISSFALSGHNERLYRAVRDHVREHGESVVTLWSLMDFDWDQAVYFQHLLSSQQIYEAIGVEFARPIDVMTRGILFLKDDEIVYYEILPQRIVWLDELPARLTIHNVPERIYSFEPLDFFLAGATGETRQGRRFYWIRFMP